MSVICLRVPENELNIFKSYAKHNNKSLSEIIRIAMLERIENEYDIKAFEEYESEKQSGTLKTRPISELWEELGL
jgi:toxin-antitoxin system protein